jgi:hypothetical protein
MEYLWQIIILLLLQAISLLVREKLSKEAIASVQKEGVKV